MKSSLSYNTEKDLQIVLKNIKKTILARRNVGDQKPSELLKMLGKIDFWCYNDDLHKENPDYQKECTCCLTHIVGLPRHPATKEEMPLTPYQVDFFEQILKAVAHPEGMTEDDWKRLHHMFHVNKGRQMGFTEIVLRIIQYFCFNRYAGSNVAIIAATNGKLADKNLRRFSRLFKKIPKVVLQGVQNHTFKLINNTTIEAFPASEEAMTGDTDYACVFMDESAKWKLVDDSPVFNSVIPIVESNGADLFLVSTPKGPMKMFYKITLDPREFVMLQYDLWEAAGNMYTKQQVADKIKNTKADPDQEYLCKFTIGQASILGAITEEDRSDKVVEWGNEETDEEDDGYDETDEEEPDFS